MKKLRSDALWHTFTPDQQKTIERWLFDEHLSLSATHAKMKAELGLTCALSTVGPMYHHLDRVRSDKALTSIPILTDQIRDSGADLQSIRAASQLMLHSRLLTTLAAGEADLRAIASLGRLTLLPETIPFPAPKAPQKAPQFEYNSLEK